MNAQPLTAAEVARLAALKDIVEPAAIGFWPPAPGWLLVALLALLLAVRVGQILWRRWQGNSYRRTALRRLRSLEAASDAQPAQRLLSAALVILRDCALAMPGTTSLPQCGNRSAWSTFLQARLLGHHPFLPEPLLHEPAYWPSARVSREDARTVLRFVRDWVEKHTPPT